MCITDSALLKNKHLTNTYFSCLYTAFFCVATTVVSVSQYRVRFKPVGNSLEMPVVVFPVSLFCFLC